MPMRVLAAVGAVLAAAQASALQPLEEFLRAARTGSPENAEARALRAQVRAEADAALGRALPGLSLRGEYARNQLETTIRLPGEGGGPDTVATITPRDQLDGFATLSVPLVDLSSFARISAARTSARAAEIREAATGLRVESLVAQDHHQLVADRALVEASRRALEVSRAALGIAEQRHRAGTAALIDVDRARAEVERNVQQLAAAELGVSLVARSLQSLTGLPPDPGAGPAPLADDLREEPPLAALQPPGEEIPALVRRDPGAGGLGGGGARPAARPRPEPRRQPDRARHERGGVIGRDFHWQAVVGLTWSFDLTTLAAIRAARAAAEGARAREQRVRLDAWDDVHRAWASVRTKVARSRSGRVQAEVSARAAEVALERYRAGTAAQLDLLQAQRDAFAAEAARIQADADLSSSRAQLRIARGESLLAGPEGAQP